MVKPDPPICIYVFVSGFKESAVHFGDKLLYKIIKNIKLAEGYKICNVTTSKITMFKLAKSVQHF